jgi:hypothetical protein
LTELQSDVDHNVRPETDGSTYDFVTKVIIELEQLGPHGWHVCLFEGNEIRLKVCQ